MTCIELYYSVKDLNILDLALPYFVVFLLNVVMWEYTGFVKLYNQKPYKHFQGEQALIRKQPSVYYINNSVTNV